MKDEIIKDLKKKPIERDMGLSIENEKTTDPGEHSFEYPTQDGKLACRGETGSKVHPRG